MMIAYVLLYVMSNGELSLLRKGVLYDAETINIHVLRGPSECYWMVPRRWP